MEIKVRSIKFSLRFRDGSHQDVVKEVIGDDEMVKWVADQFAEVNECAVIATEGENQVAIAGNIQD
ncbi:endoribonuclease [Pseudomonas phage Zuri]|uniref:Integrase n=1 Tax=Pseudomonas phage Zuri TaxID=2604899 RepID=A0A5C1K4X2_9CAUD|nr:endoribonuclease [Pseudomonas phage Zuri]QEM41101.1 integrase [Pseudomonas phage Zuri]